MNTIIIQKQKRKNYYYLPICYCKKQNNEVIQ